jgi:hypothetical protein
MGRGLAYLAVIHIVLKQKIQDNREAESLSRYNHTASWLRRADAGINGEISPSRVFFTACALRRSGTLDNGIDFSIC